jgi:hypothetical protein
MKKVSFSVIKLLYCLWIFILKQWNNFLGIEIMKKIGRYYRKIGIGIGSLESRNFAHLWIYAC